MTRIFDAIVIGASVGGLKALSVILPSLPMDFPVPVLVVQHQLSESDDFLPRHLNRISTIGVKEACPGELATGGYVYISPPGYHLLVEVSGMLSLSVDLPVSYSIPSIDVLFESAADAFGEHLIAVVLTGANMDGSHGLKEIIDCGGLAVVQSPATAESPAMPIAAIAATDVDHILPLDKIGPLLVHLIDRSMADT